MHRPEQNLILASLPDQERRRLFPQLELTNLTLAETLQEAGESPEYAYFPTNSLISMIFVMANGASSEISMVGREGLVGVSMFMGRSKALGKVVVSSSGYAYRLKEAVLLEEFSRSEATQQLLLRYTQALLTQMAQTAVCNRHHTLEQQLCRRLLLTMERLQCDTIKVTHKMISDALGVRREGITEAAVRLQSSGLISYRRGRITVLDVSGLEKRGCECYGVVKNEFTRLLPPPTGFGAESNRSAAVGLTPRN